MSELTKIRSSQIEYSIGNDGIVDGHIASSAAIAQSKINGLVAKLADIDANILSEVNRAVAAEGDLSSVISALEASSSAALTSEINARVAADNEITANLAQEVLDRQTVVSDEAALRLAADNALTANLNQEITDRTTADNSLLVQITNRYTKSEVDAKFTSLLNGAPEVLDTLKEIADALNNDPNLATTITNLISAEVSARQVADNEIAANLAQEIADRSSAISSEAATRLAADNALTASINSLSADLTSEEGRASLAEMGLSNDISEVAGDLAQEVLDRKSAVSTEQAARIAGDQAIASDLADEVDRAQGAESTLTGLISDEEARATAAEEALQTALDNLNAAGASDLADEVARAKAAESAIASDLSAEVSRASNAEALLNAAVTAEVARAVAAEAVIQNALDSEITRAVAADADRYTKAETDQRFQNLINAAPAALDTLGEIADQLAADESAAAALTTALGNEVTRATAAEGGIASDLASEVARATAAEAGLTSDLASEVARATAAEGGIASDLSQEVSDRTAAVAALSGSNGVQRVDSDFSVKLASNSGLIADSNGLKVDVNSVLLLSHLAYSDPFSGVVDGVNTVFTLSKTPLAGTVQVFLRGLKQRKGEAYDYVIDGSTITFNNAPKAGDWLDVDYISA